MCASSFEMAVGVFAVGKPSIRDQGVNMTGSMPILRLRSLGKKKQGGIALSEGTQPNVSRLNFQDLSWGSGNDFLSPGSTPSPKPSPTDCAPDHGHEKTLERPDRKGFFAHSGSVARLQGRTQTKRAANDQQTRIAISPAAIPDLTSAVIFVIPLRNSHSF